MQIGPESDVVAGATPTETIAFGSARRAEKTPGLNAAAEIGPDRFGLSPNYPNPFNPTTTISFQLPDKADVTLAVYNMRGQKVRTLVRQELGAGYYDIVWEGRDDQGRSVASGVYIYQMRAGTFNKINKMTLMK
jgi:hypothetical protein